jgi:spoIIIJ-associated protein
MTNNCQEAAEFINTIFHGTGLALNAEIQDAADGCRLNIDGSDADLLIAQGGELLEALQHLLNQAFAEKFPKGERVVCDAQGFRATREAELRAMAAHAAQHVRSTGAPFSFGQMTANERRIIHLSLANEADIHTESVGEGPARKLRVSLRKSSG